MYQIWCSYKSGAVSNYDQVRSKLRGELASLSLRQDANRSLIGLTIKYDIYTYAGNSLQPGKGSWTRVT